MTDNNGKPAMLTKKQLDLLEFIHVRVQRDGVPPSFDEMKEALDLRSKSGIHRLITALEERGFIRRLAHRARALEIVKMPDALAQKLDKKSAGFTPRVVDGGKPDQTPPAAMPVDADGSVNLPMMGQIAAGVPIEAVAHAYHNVAVPPSMLGKGFSNHSKLSVSWPAASVSNPTRMPRSLSRASMAVEGNDIPVAAFSKAYSRNYSYVIDPAP